MSNEPKTEIKTTIGDASAFPVGRHSKYEKVLQDLAQLEPGKMLQVEGAKLPSLRIAVGKLPQKYALAEREGIIYIKLKPEVKKKK